MHCWVHAWSKREVLVWEFKLWWLRAFWFPMPSTRVSCETSLRKMATSNAVLLPGIENKSWQGAAWISLFCSVLSVQLNPSVNMYKCLQNHCVLGNTELLPRNQCVVSVIVYSILYDDCLFLLALTKSFCLDSSTGRTCLDWTCDLAALHWISVKGFQAKWGICMLENPGPFLFYNLIHASELLASTISGGNIEQETIFFGSVMLCCWSRWWTTKNAAWQDLLRTAHVWATVKGMLG